MNKLIPLVAALALTAAPVAFAQTTAPAPAPAQKPPAMEPVKPAPSVRPSEALPSARTADLTLTDQQAKQWVDKKVYSSDGKNIGEVAAFQRDSTGKVSEMHADIGGFLGIGETRVRLTPAQFKLEGDRVVLNMTSEQAKALPKIAK